MGKVGKAVSKPFKSVTKGISGTAKSIAKGDISGALKNAASAWTMGVSDSLLGGLNEQPQVVDNATETLAAEAESTAKKRKSMYFTEGEELGQDTTRVFNTQKRGNIFS
jgi:hypothetical protein